MSLPRLPPPFYNYDGVTLTVASCNSLILRLYDVDIIDKERDTGFIQLPSALPVVGKEKFKFYIVCNRSIDNGNEFGLWIYAFDPQFNRNIKDCSFRVVKGNNKMDLPPTILLDSVIGVYRSPCHEIVTSDAELKIEIILPNMTFPAVPVRGKNLPLPLSPLKSWHTSKSADVKEKAKQRSVVNISDQLAVAYKDMMNEANYDVYFVVDGKKIGSFKFPLCAVSDVFRAAFKDHTKESQTGAIAIRDFEYDIVKMFVNSLHTYQINFDDNPVTTLKMKMLANKYNVTSIECAALNAFNVDDVNRSNFVAVYR